jgi:hypothetical protein
MLLCTINHIEEEVKILKLFSDCLNILESYHRIFTEYMSMEHAVRGILFCRYCLCRAFFVRIRFSACCEDVAVDFSVCVVLVFVRLAYQTLRKI